MNRLIIRSILAFILVTPLFTYAGHGIPSSPRSREAISRMQPKLEEELVKKGINFGAPIYIRIFKEERELEVWIKGNNDFRLFKKYPICTYGYGTLGPKIKQGDGQAPEGFYYVTPIQLNPVSNFHLSFNLGYPNHYDRIYKRTGSALMVHGSCVSIGCYAMTDEKIEEIYTLADAALGNGQSFFRVHAFPFKMTNKNMKKHRKSEWYSFWTNLKEGYEYFEHHGNLPPNVEVRNKKYVFEKP